MDYSTTVLLVVVGLIVVNQLVMRVGALKAQAVFFWAVQACNIGVGSALIWYGLPGFEHLPIPGFESMSVVSLVLALIFFFRTVMNTNTRAIWLRQLVVAEREEKKRLIQDSLQTEE